MVTEEEWEEIEKTQRKIENQMVEQYGTDITKIAKDSEKTKERVLKANKFLDKALKVFLTIIVLFEIGFIILLALAWRRAKIMTEEQLNSPKQGEMFYGIIN